MRGLIGKKLSHSFSKEIHETLDQQEYNLIELAELDSFFREKAFSAINVTIPYKSDVIPFLDTVSESAKEINAVNTIVNENGKLRGYNTDVDGLLYAFDYYKVSIKNRVIGIIGNGATSRTVKYGSTLKKAKIIKVFARNPKENEYPLSDISLHKDINIIINATPNGMYPNNNQKTLINVEDFPTLEFVLDLVYNPLKTKLILEAREHNVRAENGLIMLIHQAVKANELFNKITYKKRTTNTIFKDIYLRQLNIVLIGMPMSGKSYYSRQIAKAYNKGLVDIDKEIEYTQKKSIQELFNEYGESGFRNIETRIIELKSKELNKAISTGGGVVLNTNNIQLLKQNGVVVFLDVSLEELMNMPTKGRPLLKDPNNLIDLFSERYDLYKNYCDVRIVKNGFNTKETMIKIGVKINEYINS